MLYYVCFVECFKFCIARFTAIGHCCYVTSYCLPTYNFIAMNMNHLTMKAMISRTSCTVMQCGGYQYLREI